MGWREWGVLIRSHGELRLVLDVVDRHNTLAADPDRYAGTGEFLKAGVVLRFRGAIFVVLGASGGGTAITSFLHRRLPLAIYDPFEKPHGWIRVRDYLWRTERGPGPSNLREAAAAGTELHSALSSSFANPAPFDWCRELFTTDDDGDAGFTATAETFYDILAISERYLAGTGRSFIYRDPARALPAVAASLSDLKALNELGFAFVSITSGVRTPTERRRASLRLLCPDADALTVARALFRHGSLAAHALLSDGAIINNLPFRRHTGDDDIYSTFFPLWEQAAGVKRNAEGVEVAATRWTIVSRVWHCRADPIGTFLDSRFGFQDPRAALVGVALLTVVSREWGPPATPLAAQMLNLAQAIRPPDQE